MWAMNWRYQNRISTEIKISGNKDMIEDLTVKPKGALEMMPSKS